MKIGYFDCFSGASGDMILGAIIAAGMDPEHLRTELARLPLKGYELGVQPVRKQGIAATSVEVRASGHSPHRNLAEIVAIIDAADGLASSIKRRAKDTFTRLAEAEAKVHGIAVEHVHFHELGAVDTIVDIVGAAVGIEHLGLERIVCSPMPVGSGTVTCAHGVLPVPAPATVELLAGVPVVDCDEEGELVTPTGAAILVSAAERFGPLPSMVIGKCGYGAGARDGRRRPNVLRLVVGEAEAEAEGPAPLGETDEIVVLEANLDDATGEQIGHAFAALFDAGALDVFTVPITMKKNRPAVLLSVLAPLDREQACEAVLFAETTTFGVRKHACRRRILARTVETVNTRYGAVRVKVGRYGGRAVTLAPEYEDCARLARACGVSLREVMTEAQQAGRQMHPTAPKEGPAPSV